MHDIILWITAACYLLAVILLYTSVARDSGTRRKLAVAMTLLGVILHGWAETQHWLIPASPRISLLNVWSLCALVAVATTLATLPLRNNVFDAGLVTLPLAVIILLAEATVDAPALELASGSLDITVHIISSVIAFGVLSIAGVYAVFVTLIDHLLRQHSYNKFVQTLPALDTLEELLFHLITVGFVILTVALGTGMVFVNDLFGQHLAHKTLLSIFAWLVFALLLWGRWKKGWRGRVAVHMTLVGIALLLLAYFGSKLILEVLLQRSWHS